MLWLGQGKSFSISIPAKNLQEKSLEARAAPVLVQPSTWTHFEPPHYPLLLGCVVVVVPDLPTEQVEGVQPVLEVIKLCFQLFVEDLEDGKEGNWVKKKGCR